MLSSSYPIRELLKSRETPLGKLLEQARAIEELNQAFAEALTPDLLPHCRVGCYHQGVLTLFSDSAAYATKLRYHVPVLLSNLRALAPWAGLCKIQVKIQTHWPQPLTTETPPNFSVSHPEISQDTILQLQALIGQLKNQPNTEALISSLERLVKHGKYHHAVAGHSCPKNSGEE